MNFAERTSVITAIRNQGAIGIEKGADKARIRTRIKIAFVLMRDEVCQHCQAPSSTFPHNLDRKLAERLLSLMDDAEHVDDDGELHETCVASITTKNPFGPLDLELEGPISRAAFTAKPHGKVVFTPSAHWVELNSTLEADLAPEEYAWLGLMMGDDIAVRVTATPWIDPALRRQGELFVETVSMANGAAEELRTWAQKNHKNHELTFDGT